MQQLALSGYVSIKCGGESSFKEGRCSGIFKPCVRVTAALEVCRQHFTLEDCCFSMLAK